MNLPVLSSIENRSFIGEGHTGATSDSAAGKGGGRGSAAGRWAAPPLRATGCLKEANPSCYAPASGPLQFASEPSLVSARTLTHRLKHRRMLVKPSRLRCIRGYNIPPKRYGIERDNQWCNLPSLLLAQRKETLSITMCHGPFPGDSTAGVD